MEAMIERCAGLDVHQETVVACVLFGPLDKKPEKAIKTFSTTTTGLLDLSDWLAEFHVTDAVMESTGVYWKPIWNILEDTFKMVLANARHVKNVPGRKTDVKDAQWLGELLRCGLIEGNFVPPEDIRDLRDLTRYRKKLIHQRTAEQNRIHKILQDANIKLTSVLSNIFGVSGHRILEAILNGEVIKTKDLEEMVDGRTKASIADITSAINGRIRRHHREMLSRHWDHMNYVQRAIEDLEKDIDDRLSPYRKEVNLLKGIPGVSQAAAATFVAEMGVDMSVFKSAKHLASWAGVSPGNYESAGKKKTSKTSQGNKALKTMAVECVLGTSRQNNRIASHRKRITKRQGKMKGRIATAHLIITIAYNILKTGEQYKELGPDYIQDKKISNEIKMIKYLKKKGYTIESSEQTA